MRLLALFVVSNCLAQLFVVFPAIAQKTINTKQEQKPKLNLPPQVIEDSPVLQKWSEEIPNILEEIKYDPAFATRLRLGFTTFPSANDAAGLNLGIEDIFIKRTGLTISTDYQTTFNGDRNAVGADLHYFLLPLGSYLNFAPLVGYRYVQSNDFFTDGIHVGLRLMLSLSRTGGGDISVSQSFINPGVSQEVGITSVSVGYALTSHLRLAGDLERQNSLEDQDNRFGVSLEWLFD
jgi:hypothetical protein